MRGPGTWRQDRLVVVATRHNPLRHDKNSRLKSQKSVAWSQTRHDLRRMKSESAKAMTFTESWCRCDASRRAATKIFPLRERLLPRSGTTPNRVDAASHYGVARDLKALFTRNAAERNRIGHAEISMPSVESFATDRADGAVEINT